MSRSRRIVGRSVIAAEYNTQVTPPLLFYACGLVMEKVLETATRLCQSPLIMIITDYHPLVKNSLFQCSASYLGSVKTKVDHFWDKIS